MGTGADTGHLAAILLAATVLAQLVWRGEACMRPAVLDAQFRMQYKPVASVCAHRSLVHGDSGHWCHHGAVPVGYLPGQHDNLRVLLGLFPLRRDSSICGAC